MNTIQLQTPDGTSVEVYLCGICKLSLIDRGVADRCCAVPICPRCGKEITDARGSVYHEPCWMQQRFDEAVKLESWDSFIYCAEITYNEGYFDTVHELRVWCKETGHPVPAWAFVCNEVSFPEVDVDFIKDHVSDNLFEDAPDQLEGLEELREALSVFNLANSGLVSYEPDYKRVVLIGGGDNVSA